MVQSLCLAYWGLAESRTLARYFVWQGVASLLLALVILVSRRRFGRRAIDAEECGLLVTYFGVVAVFAVGFREELNTTAAVAGCTCVVYAVSLWRRARA
jgi:hypothetical protein